MGRLATIPRVAGSRRPGSRCFLPREGSIAGTVTDSSGAVLPGVTVEVASAALIERVRSAVTDGTGQHSDRQPAARRLHRDVHARRLQHAEARRHRADGQLHRDGQREPPRRRARESGDGDRRSADRGRQNTARQRIVDRDIIENIPAGRNIWALGALSPGITTNVPQDVGGARDQRGEQGMSSHGGRSNDGWTSMDGITMNAIASTGFTTRLIYSMASVRRSRWTTPATRRRCRPAADRINIVPREGGSTFNGTFILQPSRRTRCRRAI